MWIFDSSVGSAGCGGVRAQAGQHRVDVVAVGQLGELGADGQVDGVVAALVLEQLGARRDQPHRRRGGAPGRAEPDLALARPAGCSRTRGRWPRSARRTRGRAVAPATSAAWPPWPLALSTRILVSASLAGATSVMSARSPARPAAAGAAVGRRRAAAGCTPRPRGRRAVGSARSPRRSASPPPGRRTAGSRAGSCADGTGRPCLSNAVPSVICATTPAL